MTTNRSSNWGVTQVPRNAYCWAIGSVARTGAFTIRRIVWGRALARAEKRRRETIRRAFIVVKI